MHTTQHRKLVKIHGKVMIRVNFDLNLTKYLFPCPDFQKKKFKKKTIKINTEKFDFAGCLKCLACIVRNILNVSIIKIIIVLSLTK